MLGWKDGTREREEGKEGGEREGEGERREGEKMVSVGEGEADAEVAAVCFGHGVVACGGAAVFGSEEEAAAAGDAAGEGGVGDGWSGGVGLGFGVVHVKGVVGPFHDVACHVVDAELVGFLGFDGVCLFLAVGFVPCHFGYVLASAVLCVAAFAASACGVFPFCFGG